MSTSRPTELEQFHNYISERIANGAAAISPEEALHQFREQSSVKARTSLGNKLREIRQQIVAGGQPLLSMEELDSEAAERRGERSAEDNS